MIACGLFTSCTSRVCAGVCYLWPCFDAVPNRSLPMPADRRLYTECTTHVCYTVCLRPGPSVGNLFRMGCFYGDSACVGYLGFLLFGRNRSMHACRPTDGEQQTTYQPGYTSTFCLPWFWLGFAHVWNSIPTTTNNLCRPDRCTHTVPQ